MPAEEVDEDLAKALLVAKKKPRNFALFSKGASILKLLVSKKPIKDEAILKTKKEVQSNTLVRGVVQGVGAELVFHVLEEPSVTDAKFKKFISETSGLMIKPRFEVVASLQEVDEEDDGDDADVPAAPVANESTASSGPNANQLLEAMNKLSPMIKQAAAAFPARKSELLSPVAEFKTAIQGNDLARARECIVQLGSLLKSLKASAPSTDAGSGKVTTIPFAEALEKWRTGQTTIKSNIAAFQKALLANEEVRADPRVRFVAAAASEIPNMLPTSSRQVEAVLTAGAAATDKQKSIDLATLALKAFTSYRNELASSSQLNSVEEFTQNRLGTPLSVLEPLRGVIGEIETMIREAV